MPVLDIDWAGECSNNPLVPPVEGSREAAAHFIEGELAQARHAFKRYAVSSDDDEFKVKSARESEEDLRKADQRDWMEACGGENAFSEDDDRPWKTQVCAFRDPESLQSGVGPQRVHPTMAFWNYEEALNTRIVDHTVDRLREAVDTAGEGSDDRARLEHWVRFFEGPDFSPEPAFDSKCVRFNHTISSPTPPAEYCWRTAAETRRSTSLSTPVDG